MVKEIASDGSSCRSFEPERIVRHICQRTLNGKLTKGELTLIIFAFLLRGNLSQKHLNTMRSDSAAKLKTAMLKAGVSLKGGQRKRDAIYSWGLGAAFPGICYTVLNAMPDGTRLAIDSVIGVELASQIPQPLRFLSVGSLTCLIPKENPLATQKLKKIAFDLNEAFSSNICRLTGVKYDPRVTRRIFESSFNHGPQFVKEMAQFVTYEDIEKHITKSSLEPIKIEDIEKHITKGSVESIKTEDIEKHITKGSVESIKTEDIEKLFRNTKSWFESFKIEDCM